MLDCKKKFNKSDIFLMIGFGLIIFWLGSYSIRKLYGLAVGVDDFGYVSNAFYMLGKSGWKDLTSILSYYSYGYSIVLVPFLLLFPNPITAFRAIILLNVCFIVISYIISIIVMLKIHEEFKNKFVIFTCFVIHMYAGNFLYSKYIFSESLICLLFWIVTLLILNILDKYSFIKLMCLGIVCAYMYYVHQRTIVIVATIMFLFVFLLLKKRIPLNGFIILFLSFFIVIMIGNIIKSNLIRQVYLNNDLVKINNFSGQIPKLQYFLTMDGILSFIQGLGGKVYYFLLSTLFVGGIGIIKLAKHIYIFVIKKKYINNITYIYIYLLLCFTFIMLLQAFSLIYPSRYDLVIYGRYAEFMFGIIMAEGLVQIYECRDKLWSQISFLIICAITGGLMAIKLFQRVALSLSTSFLAPTLFMFYSGKFSRELRICVFVSLGIVITIAVFLYFIILRKVNVYTYIIMGVLCVICWTRATLFIDEEVIAVHFGLKSQYMPMVEIIAESNNSIGFLLEESSVQANEIRIMQYLLADKEIEYLDLEQVVNNKQECMIITERVSQYRKDIIKQGGKVLFENSKYVLWDF